MGCDIHMYVEKRINDKWVAADKFVREDVGYTDVPYEDRIYTGRNYDLFCFLAGVRCDYEDEDMQHFEQKGFPDDASPEVKEICVVWGADGHSHSWLTLEELQTVNWEDDKIMMIKQSGIMNNECPIRIEFKDFYENVVKRLPSYCKEGCKPNELRIVFWFDN